MQWHRSRARGQRERFASVAECGDTIAKAMCGACGEERVSAPVGCRNFRVCRECRRRRIDEYVERFRRSREAFFVRPEIAGLCDARPAWGEKFVTLTVPHAGTAADGVRELQRAWPLFARALRVWLEVELGVQQSVRKEALQYLCVLEATPGSDGGGHPHFHLWIHSPYIPQRALAFLWGSALTPRYRRACPTESVESIVEGEKNAQSRELLRRTLVTRRGPNGRPLSRVRLPNVDIRRASGDVGRELIKYLVKDGDKGGPTDPEVFARLFLALEGKRSIRASRGFLFHEPPADVACEHCGTFHAEHVCFAPNPQRRRATAEANE